MKKSLLLSILLILGILTNAQCAYKNQLETKNGVNVYYKVVHEKHFKKDSPAQLRLKFKNTNDYPVIIRFKIEYSTGYTTRYTSEGIEVCIPKKSVKAGKLHGLVFELKTNDIEIFSKEDAEWEFSMFEVTQTENCKSDNN
ncbi:MAG: hypothetical protein PHH30_04000 [Bacteroidales bacterium]|nr:hypothetical protein [Bacteroidales bacterium]MDD3859179.1 hypothetical protein [Bacteroidales bacterium]